MRRPGLVVFFIVTLLLPGTALVVFGARALLQERQLVDHEMRERLDRAADGAIQQLEREFHDWELFLDRARTATPDRAALPSSLGAAFGAPGAAVFLPDINRAEAWPAGGLLYALAEAPATTADAVLPPAVREAEALELRNDLSAAAARYESLLATTAGDVRPWLLHRLARTNRKAGHRDQALRRYHQLLEARGSIGALPAALVGRYELCADAASRGERVGLSECALRFYRQLISGEWQLAKERYMFYASTAREWLAQSSITAELLHELTSAEGAKAALTSSAESIHRSTCVDVSTAANTRAVLHDDVFAMTRCSGRDDGGRPTAIVVQRAWLARHVWPAVFDGTTTAGYHVAITDRDDKTLFESDALPSSSIDVPVALRDGRTTAAGLRVRVWPRDPAAIATTLVRRQRMYVLTTALVIASLVFGTYATSRVVKRELQVAQLKSEFAATVSHEFRSPLTAIRQLGEMLSRNRVPEDRRPEYYDRITREAERLSSLVENLLDFAQMESGRKQYRMQSITTTDWLRNIVSEFQSIRADQGVVVEASIPESLPVISADAAALSSAIHNLLDNAIKYSPGQNTIWMDAEASGGRLVISVRDRGVGISRQDRNRIFEKFYRADGDISLQVKGAGLGLSLVQHIVAAHNGRVECQSDPGVGTTFAIHLNADAARS